MIDINLNLNKIFYEVALAGSFGKASNILQIDSSNISRYITQLEEELKVKLFFRNNKGVKLTPDGQKYFEFVEKGLGYFKAGEKLVHDHNDLNNGEIVIGSLSHISHFLLVEKLKKAKEDYPNLKIKVITGATSDDLVSMLENHKIDFALDSTSKEITNKDIQKKQLKTVANIFVSNTPLTLKSLKELEDYKLILGLDYTNTSNNLFDLLKSNNVSIKADMEIDTTELKIDVAKMGLGLAYVMEDAVKKEIEKKELYKVELPIALPSSHINLLHLKNQLTNVDKKFIKEYLNTAD